MARYHLDLTSGLAVKCPSGLLRACPVASELHAYSSRSMAAIIRARRLPVADAHDEPPTHYEVVKPNSAYFIHARHHALQGFKAIMEGYDLFPFEASWEAAAISKNVSVDYLPPMSGIHVAAGGAAVHVGGDVGENSVIVTQGGGAEISIEGDVLRGSRIMCTGGSATIWVHGRIHAGAEVLVRGGGAQVHSTNPEFGARVGTF